MVNVIGMGYIGLPTALMMAAHGIEVIGTDYDEKRIERLKNGEMVFEEEGLAKLFQKAQEGGIVFSTQYQSADVYVVAVPTPYIKESKKLDASCVINAVEHVIRQAPKGAVIVIESTISPGTIEKVIKPLFSEYGRVLGQDIHIAHAPERIIPGSMIYELEHNSRTIGADDVRTGERIRDIYASFCQGEIVLTTIKTAEMSKVVENTFRDINIAYANELAKICRSDEMDVYEIIRVANKHPRVNILQPGPGVGGHCISVDPWFLVGDYPGLANIILAARKINDSMPDFVLSRTCEIMKECQMSDLDQIGIYGLTYKENVDDVRESPTLQLLTSMKRHLAAPVRTFDPFVKQKIVENQTLDFEEFLEKSRLIVVMTAHTHIKEHACRLRNKIVLDTRNLFADDEIETCYKL